METEAGPCPVMWPLKSHLVLLCLKWGVTAVLQALQVVEENTRGGDLGKILGQKSVLCSV